MLESRTLLTVTIQIDYSYDTNHFFDTQAKKDLLQYAANSIADNLNNHLAAIVPSGTNTWTASFLDPSSTSGTVKTIPNLVVPADTLILYVGGSNLQGQEKGTGGPGGYSWTGTAEWGDLVEGRGQPGATQPNPTVFSTWGGAVSFQIGGSSWYFGTSASGLGPNQVDFLSVATHEICHVLGFGDLIPGQQTAWSQYVKQNTFTGPNSEAAHGGTPVPLDSLNAHWVQGTTSCGAEAIMTPIIYTGTRKLMTPLDYAGLQDMGWNVQVNSTVQFSVGTFYTTDQLGSATITVNRSYGGGAAAVTISTSDGTARGGVNYTPTKQTVTFAAGELSKSIKVPIAYNDLPSVPNQTFYVSLSNYSGVSPGTMTRATVMILHSGQTGPSSGDFDGDGIADPAVFEPSTSTFYLARSRQGNIALQFGIGTLWGGHPINVSADYDGDGITDPAEFEPSTSTFYIHTASGNRAIQFGIGTKYGGTPIPVPGNYEGDGMIDPAVFEPSTATFYIARHNAPNIAIQFGIGTKYGGLPIPVPAAYEGRGVTDPAVFEPSTSTFYIARHSAPNIAIQFGIGTKYGGAPVAIPNNYEGDGVIDPAVFEPSTSTFYIARHSSPNTAIQFGIGTKYGGHPVVASAAYEGDGQTDPAVFEPSTATFYIARHNAPNIAQQFGIGTKYGGSPIVSSANFEGDGQIDPAVFEPSTSTFYILKHKAPNQAVQFGIGTKYGGHPVPISATFASPLRTTVTAQALGTVVANTSAGFQAASSPQNELSAPAPGTLSAKRRHRPIQRVAHESSKAFSTRRAHRLERQLARLHDSAIEALQAGASRSMF